MTEKEEKKAETKKEVKEEAPKPKKIVSKQKQIEIYAKRLERLLSTSAIVSTDNDVNDNEIPTTYSNPVKVVRRWLSTTSTLTLPNPEDKALTLTDISKAIDNLYNPNSTPYKELKSLLSDLAPTSMETEEEKTYPLKKAEREVQAWLMSLITRLLYRSNDFKHALKVSTQSLSIIQTVIETSKYPIGSLYPLLARLYRYHCLIAEYNPASQGYEELHPVLINAHRIACLHLDIDTQSTLLNLLLRSLLASHQIEQAQKLLSNSTFPETASNNQTCRYLYYSGRIQALRLEYTTSYSNLSTCLRKAPTGESKGIVGFRIEVTRLLSIVQLLMGDIPPRSLFTSHQELTPYLKLTQAVRKGDLHIFSDTVQQFRGTFIKDGMLTLISRLEHSVVKAGLRKLYLSYSKISLQDIATRLALPSATTAEFIVAKAIKDGVIDATIDHENQLFTVMIQRIYM